MKNITEFMGHTVDKGDEGGSGVYKITSGFIVNASSFGKSGHLSIGRSQFCPAPARVFGKVYYPDGRTFDVMISRVAPFLACSHGVKGLPSSPSVDDGNKQCILVLDDPTQSIEIFKQFSA